MGVERELQAEQEFVDLAYARLDAMRSDANRMLEGVLDLGKGGTFQSRTERDVIVRTSLARLEQLDIGDQALTFGRIDRVVGETNGSGPTDEAGSNGLMTEMFHIGRLAVHSADHEPLVVDWRAPVAEPFYRATGRDPQGLVLRREGRAQRREPLPAVCPQRGGAGRRGGDRQLQLGELLGQRRGEPAQVGLRSAGDTRVEVEGVEPHVSRGRHADTMLRCARP